MSKTMRITDDSFAKLEELEIETGKNKQDLIELALKELSRKLFFNKINNEFVRLKKNKDEWQDYMKDRLEWESLDSHEED